MSLFPSFTKNFKNKIKEIRTYIEEKGCNENYIDMEYIIDIETILQMKTELKYSGTFYDRMVGDNFMIFQTDNTGGIMPLSIGISIGFLEEPSRDYIVLVHNLYLFNEYTRVQYNNSEINDLAIYREVDSTLPMFRSAVPRRLPVSLKDELENMDLFEMSDEELTHLRFLI